MADEGLVLAARAKARLGQSLSAAQHTEGHLQVVGVGEWRPTSTRPSWNAEPPSLVLRRAPSSDPNPDAGHEAALLTNIVEGEFSEVRRHGVLRTSPFGCSAKFVLTEF
jgi:hypothetical protein